MQIRVVASLYLISIQQALYFYPYYLSVLLRALLCFFSDNLSRNSCMCKAFNCNKIGHRVSELYEVQFVLTAGLSCWSIGNTGMVWVPVPTPLNDNILGVTEVWVLVTNPSGFCPKPGVALVITGFSKGCWET